MVSDKTIFKAFRIHKTLYKQNLFETFFIFTIYQNYTLALSHTSTLYMVQLKEVCAIANKELLLPI